MKLLIVRHGDPDYTIDSLTEKGWREAELLAKRLTKEEAKAYYVSILGRAKDTASFTLQQLNRTAVECDWLQEFPVRILRPDLSGERSNIGWDWLPQDWMTEPCFFKEDEWFLHPVMQEAKVKEQYDYVVRNLDRLLEQHGYRRSGRWYEPIAPNNDTLVFFCHFGLECVLLSHFLHVSPMILWHGLCAAPTSVTTVVTEERRPGIASFRVTAFGDISHLYAADEPPAFAARFRECYTNEYERRD
ncbi:MAG: histidine phosphatase family protein [Lachnospiraceae bacterium]|nr:histidine phosphatase family protein [Lachnospiraceae bacterium]